MVIDKFHDDFRFLSNFFPAIVEFEGITFPTVEHAYQAAKFLDIDRRHWFANLSTPAKAKRYSRQIKDPIRPDWDTIKLSVMRQLVHQKFFVNHELGARLLGTGDSELIEGNTWGDVFFGVCNGVGENHLGKILMDVRNKLKLTN